MAVWKRKKREPAPAFPDARIYKNNYITEKERIKEKFQNKPLQECTSEPAGLDLHLFGQYWPSGQ
jgi:hypothetical protein